MTGFISRLRRVKSKDICLLLLALPKTLYFNLKYFSFRDAVRLPIIVSHRVLLSDCSGAIRITAPIRTGMVRIGFGYVGIFDQSRSRSIWEVGGLVEFGDGVSLGHGTKISVGKEGTLILNGGGGSDCRVSNRLPATYFHR